MADTGFVTVGQCDFNMPPEVPSGHSNKGKGPVLLEFLPLKSFLMQVCVNIISLTNSRNLTKLA